MNTSSSSSSSSIVAHRSSESMGETCCREGIAELALLEQKGTGFEILKGSLIQLFSSTFRFINRRWQTYYYELYGAIWSDAERNKLIPHVLTAPKWNAAPATMVWTG